MDEEENHQNSRKCKRKVCYGHYYHSPNKRIPVIRIAGNYLKVFGFNVGDFVEIEIYLNHIVIKKLNTTSEKEA